MVNLLSIFLVIVAVKFVINLVNYIRCKRYLKQYDQYLKEPDWKFVEHQQQIVKLFRGAGLQDASAPLTELVGYGYIRTGHLSLFDNIAVTREDIVQMTLTLFHQAVGVYRSRMLESFNPLYWMELAIHLPRHGLSYLGIPPESVVTKIAQIITG